MRKGHKTSWCVRISSDLLLESTQLETFSDRSEYTTGFETL